ncbi:ATP-dependent DNA helicase RecG [Blattabacterium cuenoti]|uniref:ATP-dependent DNA helicase RecG n=1 Tax=Blattabacterium cuenoti TaxID=1653831 RepID=UPI00163BD652|nr:ATP-dependent DNA helicase RecG [Blattabacterium cuenoti]
MSCDNNILQKSIKYLKELSLKKIRLFNEKLNIYTYEDLLFFYPKGYIHAFYKKIGELYSLINNNTYVYISGNIIDIKEIKKKNNNGKILIALLKDSTGIIEIIWFRKTNIFKILKKNIPLIVFGKPIFFQKKIQIIHPNIYKYHYEKKIRTIYPLYDIPNNLKKLGINNNLIIRLLNNIFIEIKNKNIEIKEFIFQNYIKKNNKFLSKKSSLIQIHFPESVNNLLKAKYSLKFDKLFKIKLFLYSKKKLKSSKPLSKIGKKFNYFYKNHLPFNLTEDQKNVFKEIWNDLKKPIQMNRLLQGEVGSGKTIIAILLMLLSLDNGVQSCIMVPTEFLAIQHYNLFKKMLSKINGINIYLLTKSTSFCDKNKIYKILLTGKESITIGTHSLIQDKVKFKNLGLVIIDEQQRFGVEQRKKIYKNGFPHILSMTSTPIPRTLAKIIYNDLNISIIKNKPIGRKKIKTIHFWNEYREKAFEIVKNQILLGKQIYIVYPIVDGEKNKYKNLINGYQEIIKTFTFLKKNQIGILHGKMNSKEKKLQIDRFLKEKTKIIVTTTIIEVGINIPNASVILIENANNFGLSQLHQLRGRVGRSFHQSYCILLSEKKINSDSFYRIQKMCKTDDGFNISKEDLRLRGEGNLMGKEQSGKKYLFIDYLKNTKFIKEVISTFNIFLKINPNFFKKKYLPQDKNNENLFQ